MSIRRLCCVCILLMLFTSHAAAVPVLREQIFGTQAILYCVESGQSLYEKNADTPARPASVTKLMTALLVLEQIQDLSQTTTVSNTAVQIERDSTHIALVPGEVVTLENMLYASLMQSANDASNVLAEAVAGSQAAFVQMMNDRAAELGCTGTHFENAHGLDGSTHLMTARDLTKITEALLHHPRFIQIAGAQSYTIPPTNKHAEPRTFYTKQRMLRKDSAFYNPYAVAGKNGYTSQAHHTQVMVAHKDGMTLIAVTLGASSGKHAAWHDIRALFTYGFGSFHAIPLNGADISRMASEVYSLQETPTDLPPVTVVIPSQFDKKALSFSSSTDKAQRRALQLSYEDGTVQNLFSMPYALPCDLDVAHAQKIMQPDRIYWLLFPFLSLCLFSSLFSSASVHHDTQCTLRAHRKLRKQQYARRKALKRRAAMQRQEAEQDRHSKS